MPSRLVFRLTKTERTSLPKLAAFTGSYSMIKYSSLVKINAFIPDWSAPNEEYNDHTFWLLEAIHPKFELTKQNRDFKSVTSAVSKFSINHFTVCGLARIGCAWLRTYSGWGVCAWETFGCAAYWPTTWCCGTGLTKGCAFTYGTVCEFGPGWTATVT